MKRKQIKRIKNTIRKIASQIHREEVLKKNKVMALGKDANGTDRMLVHHPCAICKKLYRPDAVEIDHIIEVGELIVNGPMKGTSYGDCQVKNWQEWMDRLLCSLDNFQILCMRCHQKKTMGFNKVKRFGGHLL